MPLTSAPEMLVAFPSHVYQNVPQDVPWGAALPPLEKQWKRCMPVLQ